MELKRAWAILLTLFMSCGCTHMQLMRSSIHQAGTITDLQYTQILQNIAATQQNPYVLPYFAVVGTGGTSISDQGSPGLELEWDASSIIREMLSLNGSREIQEQWTLAPVVNPDKLRAMRSVFQLVVCRQAYDPEADKILRSFLGDTYIDWIPTGWYGVGPKDCVPPNAAYVAHRGSTYVWVMPEGVDALSRLTIAVLNIATLDPTPPPDEPTKTIQQYIYDGERLSAIETYLRPDPEGVKGSRATIRQDFYNPIQSQIQIQSSGGR